MNTSPTQSSQPGSQASSPSNPLLANIDRLRHKLKGFTVIDSNNQAIGNVKDLTLDANQNLHLIVVIASQGQTEQRQVLLSSRLIQRVSTQTHSIFVSITQSDISFLPNYAIAADPQSTQFHSNAAGATVQHPVDQLPATASAHTETGEYLSSSLEESNSSEAGLFEYSPTPKTIATDVAEPSDSSASDYEFSSPDSSTTMTATSSDIPKHNDAVSDQASLNAPEMAASATADLASHELADSAPETAVIREEINIPLLAERLQVDYKRHKIGEVIIRKQIETRMVQVPVRYEKLLIEQVSPQRQQLAEVNLSQDDIASIDAKASPIVSGEFTSPKVASQVLNAIAKTLHHRCKRVRIELELDSAELSETYQAWINHYRQQ